MYIDLHYVLIIHNLFSRSLTSSLHTNDKRKTTVEHAYGKFIPKYYKSIPEIDKSLDPAKL